MRDFASVQLRDQLSASQHFHQILLKVVQTHVEFHASTCPISLREFQRSYIQSLPQFEAARLALENPNEIADILHREIGERFVFQEGDSSQPLSEYLQRRAKPLPTKSVKGRTDGVWKFDLDYLDRTWRSPGLLAEELLATGVVNRSAAECLKWADQQFSSSEGIDLTDRKVVVFGAGAEMASTSLFLSLGAEVLWLDMLPPPAELQTGQYTGTLHWTESPADLLHKPREVLATVVEFAAGDAVDLCLYAYAPGQARELRLSGAMNAIVDALPTDLVRSITMLVSPTTASSLHHGDLEDMDRRRVNAPMWERIMAALGLLGRHGKDIPVSQTLVGIQGTSYQAAQYLCKVIAAEHWHAHGYRVSANTAAITKTKSLDHPVFDAAFGGAKALQVETLLPIQSQTISGLLAIHDWLTPERQMPGHARVHGGIHTLPYPLNTALRTAAAIGFARSPSLLLGLLRR